jgi:hypothetical protein
VPTLPDAEKEMSDTQVNVKDEWLTGSLKSIHGLPHCPCGNEPTCVHRRQIVSMEPEFSFYCEACAPVVIMRPMGRGKMGNHILKYLA